MPGKLLNLTFHEPGVLTGEDLRFKSAAIASGLISGDAMDEMGSSNDGPKPFLQANKDLLMQSDKKPELGGLTVVKMGNTSLVSFNAIKAATWGQPGYTFQQNPGSSGHSPSTFEEWMTKVFVTPIEVLVLAGHHADDAVWGSETRVRREHRFHCALFPEIHGSKSDLGFFGFGPNKADRLAPLRAGFFDLTRTLANCRLLVVFGCNGATVDIIGWRNWIRKARGGLAPYILGFYGVHSFPRDAGGQSVSPFLWHNLEQLAPGTPGNKNLDFLDDLNFFERTRDAWFDAVKRAFPIGSTRGHLLFSTFNSDGGRGPRGAGCISPDGRLFFINDLDGHFAEGERLP